MVKRIQEILSKLTAFDEVAYSHEDLLSELFKLQDQLVQIVFNESHANLANLKIWDIKRHLQKLNEECGNVADDLMIPFFKDCNTISNLIRSEYSGNRGERKAQWGLKKVQSENILLNNIEFKDDVHRTELDSILITKKAIFVVEVKNPSRNIYINEHGNFYRVGEYSVLDQNIGEKMDDKVYFLREALKNIEVQNINIQSIVTFTNHEISVENNYPYIQTCFLSELPHIIDNYPDKEIYTDDELKEIKSAILSASCKEKYPLPIDIDCFKENFATILAKLESALSKEEETKEVYQEHFEDLCKEKYEDECEEVNDSDISTGNEKNPEKHSNSWLRWLIYTGFLAAGSATIYTLTKKR